MLSNFHSVLQVSPQTAGESLERAWQVCRARFVRLTARGPLRFYRQNLLKRADNAYKSLCGGSERSSGNSHESFLTREVKRRGETAKELDRPNKAKIEDEFCLEVLYRLEGDLLRFSCRLELLKLAQQAGIHAFRANMLMAQIIESVRQYKLYEPSEVEKKIEAKGKAVIHKYRGGKMRKLALGLAVLCLLIDVLIVVVWLTPAS